MCSQDRPDAKPANEKILIKALASYKRNYGTDYINDLNLALAQGTSREAYSAYADLLRRIQSALMGDWRKQGITTASIKKRIQQSQNILATRFKSQNKNEVAARIRNMKLILASDLKKTDSTDKLLNFYLFCGVHGLIDGAFYDPNSNSLTLCPGLLSAALPTGIAQIDFPIFHEMSHSVAQRNGPLPPESYSSFIACQRKQVDPSLRSIKSILEFVQNQGLNNLSQYLSQLESSPGATATQVLRVRQFQSSIGASINYLKAAQKEFDHIFPPMADSVQTHSEELIADTLGAEVLSQFIKSESDLPMLKVQLARFCPNDPEGEAISQLTWGTANDDGVHPAGKFRIEYITSNPQLRKRLGCKTPAPYAWCSL